MTQIPLSGDPSTSRRAEASPAHPTTRTIARVLTATFAVLVGAVLLTEGAIAAGSRMDITWTSAPEAASWGD